MSIVDRLKNLVDFEEVTRLTPQYILQQISRFHGKGGHLTVVKADASGKNVVFDVYAVSALSKEFLKSLSFTEYILTIFGGKVNPMVRMMLKGIQSKIDEAGRGIANAIKSEKGVEAYAIFRDQSGETVLYSVDANMREVEKKDIGVIMDALGSVSGVEIESAMEAQNAEDEEE